MEKAFSCGKTGKWPEKRRTGKRANEIECPEKGKGKAPDLKSEARSSGGLAMAHLAVEEKEGKGSDRGDVSDAEVAISPVTK